MYNRYGEGRGLIEAVENSFNRISVDGDQSTSDMVLALSSQRAQTVPEPEPHSSPSSCCFRGL